ncbi:MAG: hypothetical protein ACPGSH_03180, partial [Ilumatobacteraceae bacterium]
RWEIGREYEQAWGRYQGCLRVLEQLEEIVDEMDDDTSGPIDLEESVHLLDEVEQFLRDHDGDA